MRAVFAQRQTVPRRAWTRDRVGAETAATASGEPFTTMVSGAAHDTMCVADRVPCAMVFVPCRDGLSHTPVEHAEPADAALGVEVVLGAIRALAGP